jgi:hypothetical protein
MHVYYWMVDSRCKCIYCIYSTVFISIYESLSITTLPVQKKTAKNVNATNKIYSAV